MKTFRWIPALILLCAAQANSANSESANKLAKNAALRYWTAFSEMQDSALSDDEAKALNAVVDGTTPYDDSKYKELIEKNRFALDIMARGTALPACDWGIDYKQGAATPVDHVLKGRALGSLNILYVLHLQTTGDNDGAVRALAAGMRFSHDIANGGTLLSALVAKRLLLAHFNVMASISHAGGLSAGQRLMLKKALAELGAEGLDWQAAVKREMEVLDQTNPQDVATLAQIKTAYLKALGDPSALPALEQIVSKAPQQVGALIPNPKRVLEQKRDLVAKLQQAQASLR
jgi:hypothetical protein